MMNRFHMQDQVNNRIEELMRNHHSDDVNEMLQNAVTLAIVSLFLLLGLSW